MSHFEYLSVLISIIVGLAITQLLSGVAGLIRWRRQVRLDVTTLCWVVLLFLIDTQIWWAAFERRDNADWNFFTFLLYLLMPITAFLLSYLVLPDLDRDRDADLAANFNDNRPWFFPLLALMPCVSLVEEALRNGGLSPTTDAMFRVVFAVIALIASRIRSARFHVWNAFFVLVLICGYVALLFLRLH